jgi:uncharacterized protein
MIIHEPERNRFSATVEDVLSVLEYSLNGRGVMTIEHTRVPPAVGGRGIASDLTRAAFDYALNQDLKIIPACNYAAVWVRRHPEFEYLLRPFPDQIESPE